MRDEFKEILDDAVLSLYRKIRYPVFPIDPVSIIFNIKNCGYISYDRLAAVSKTSYQEVVKACNSYDGCTQYDIRKDRYLIAINNSASYGASKQRIRWTSAHELGHVFGGHFTELAHLGKPGTPSDYQDMEEEADYFAASLLAPLPAIKLLRAKRPADIRDWFGLSQTASEYRWHDFQTMRPDERLEDRFHVFRPSSTIKDMQRSSTRKIDITVDAGFFG